MQLYGITFQEESAAITMRRLYCMAMEEFRRFYMKSDFYRIYRQYDSIPAILKSAPNDLYVEFLPDVIHYILDIVCQFEVYDYDFQRVAKIYTKYAGHYLAACNDLYAAYCELKGDERAAQIAREQAKDNRGRLVGGGFGLGGAAKGIAMAGAANLATGAIYSAGNAVGNMITKLNTDSQINQLRSSYGQKLYEALYQDFMVGVDVLEEILVSIGGVQMQNPFTSQRLDKAKAVMKNIECGRVPSEKGKELLVNALIDDAPYYDEIYVFAYKSFGDDEGRLLEIASLFGKTDLIDRIKQQMAKAKKLAAEKATNEAEEALERKFFGENYEAARNAIRDRFDFTDCYIDALMGLYLDHGFSNLLQRLCTDNEFVQALSNDGLVIFENLPEDERKEAIEKYRTLCDSEKIFQEGEIPFCFISCGIQKGKKGILVTSKGLYFSSGLMFRISFMHYDGIYRIEKSFMGGGDIIYKGEKETSAFDEKVLDLLTLTVLYFKYGDEKITKKLATDVVSESEKSANRRDLIFGVIEGGIGAVVGAAVGIGFWVFVISCILRACSG